MARVPQQRLTSDEYLNFRAAFDAVKEFPEFKPDERSRWLAFRRAAEKYFDRWG